MTNSNEELLADATDLVINRLEAMQAGDLQRLARIDASAPKDGEGLTALWAAAFGIAERSLNVLASRDPSAAEELLQSFREQVTEFRRQASQG